MAGRLERTRVIDGRRGTHTVSTRVDSDEFRLSRVPTDDAEIVPTSDAGYKRIGGASGA